MGRLTDNFADVRFGSLADIDELIRNVRLAPESEHAPLRSTVHHVVVFQYSTVGQTGL